MCKDKERDKSKKKKERNRIKTPENAIFCPKKGNKDRKRGIEFKGFSIVLSHLK